MVLRHPEGITYQEISKRTKLEIYNISHYCCRLKKMNFVRLEHNKSEKRVFPRDVP
jgi:DNA-binding MarR family transcriptional regulator